ncbi:LOW QUALITY PROTEIN: zinc transporter ZIP3-like [Amphiura filiformis]|uniref:LOW QUALITY PROTEIN: zinc transporter ZIP3-like n=1 Tax=Amphiura filiformis TaxID=82378 RepID=UPI003B2254AE
MESEHILVLKIVCIIIVFSVTLLGALLPYKIFGDVKKPKSRSRQHKSERILSFSNCLAGGVFLATCFLGLIPAARKKFESVLTTTNYNTDYPVCEATVVAGFFIILYMEQIVMAIQQKWMGKRTTNGVKMKAIKKKTNKVTPIDDYEDEDEDDIYSRNEDEKPLVKATADGWSEDTANESEDIEQNNTHLQGHGHSHKGGHSHLGDVQDSGTLRSFILLFALSIHSIFEGMALGLQDELKNTLYLLLAMILHEGLAAFALGASLLKNSVRFSLYILYGIAFSSMIPCGTLIGIAIHTSKGIVADTVSAIMQALAAGIFIFVTFFEILNHEFDKTEDRLLKICCALGGFVVLAALEILG